MKRFLLIIIVVCLSGCLAKSTDVKKNAESASDNSKSISKIIDLINVYHKNEKTEALSKQMKAIAKAQFEESLKDKGFVNSETAKKVAKGVASLTGVAGIPYGGLIMDGILYAISLFGGVKGAQKVVASSRRRKKEDEDWKKYLASLDPEEAEKAIKANGI